jgi:hypothetical protein|tara:strand:+ start:560 stop:907 length:348 start_codon:yes stop_codon:yes gene_type:complete
MDNNVKNVEVIPNKSLIEKYKPILVVKLSTPTTIRLGDDLEKFALDIREKSGYEVITFPNEEETEVKVVSICESESIDITELKDYIYTKYKSPGIQDTPFTKIKDIIKKRNLDGE